MGAQPLIRKTLKALLIGERKLSSLLFSDCA